MNILTNLSEPSSVLLRQIGEVAQSQGMKAYLVGGPVRDLLLDSSHIDLDITVEGNGIRLAQKFAKLYPRVKVVAYPAFKTATVFLLHGQQVDFATARRETYKRPGAFPQVVPSCLHDDLFRRDFTINAMAVSICPPTWGKVIDPFGGGRDLRAKKIRVLHKNSFIDDPTRILRAARLAARLHFTFEPATLKLIKEAIEGKALETISKGRYKKEMDKIKKEQASAAAMAYLKSWKALKRS